MEADPAKAESEPQRLRIFRTVFALRSPLPAPDGLVIAEQITNGPHHLEGGDAVYLRFHEVWSSESALAASLSAADEISNRLMVASSGDGSPDHIERPRTVFRHTVVEAVTAETFEGQARNAHPSDDSIMRIIEAISQVARAFRLAGAPAVEIPTYESLPPVLMTWSSTGVGTSESFAFEESAQWVPELLLMETLTASPDFIDQSITPVPEGDLEQRARHWMYALRTGDPLTRSLEWLRRAQYSLDCAGSYADAVLHASTASEVLTDGLLSALMWEEHFRDPSQPGPGDRAPIFVEGRGKSRATGELRTRLGGNWDNLSSPWQVWVERVSKLRNRIIHGGYAPTRVEAEAAVVSSLDLQTWLCDLLCNKRTDHIRVAITVLGQEGLKKRNAWNGKVRSFAETEADAEDHWGTAFAEWHAALVAHI